MNQSERYNIFRNNFKKSLKEDFNNNDIKKIMKNFDNIAYGLFLYKC